MTVTLYRSYAAIRQGDYTCAEWTDLDFAPREPEHRVSLRGYYHHRSIPELIAIEAPAGARLVEREGTTWLSCYAAPGGIDAHLALAYARRGAFQFRMGDDMARKQRDDGPGLFGDKDPDPWASAYPRATVPTVRVDPPADRSALRPVVAEIAAEVLAESDRVLARAVERAIAVMDAEPDDAARLATVRAILETGLAEAGITR